MKNLLDLNETHRRLTNQALDARLNNDKSTITYLEKKIMQVMNEIRQAEKQAEK